MRSAILVSVVVASHTAAVPATAQGLHVYHVPLAGSITLEHAQVVERAIAAAEREGGSAIVLDVSSPGGRMDMAQLIVSHIATTNIPVYVLVNKRAWDAAALVALGADAIFMGPESSIGAGPDRSDDLSPAAQRAIQMEFRIVAERRGLDPRLGAAMVEDDVTIGGVVAAGERLTLDAEAAVQVGVAAAQVNDVAQLLTRLGLVGPEVVTVGANWAGTTVQVKNYNVMDARIYVFRGSAPYRLGTVTSMGSAEFDVPEAFLPDGARIRVVAELIGSSERTETEEMRVQPGLLVQWVLEARLSQSNYFFSVRP